jgi:hypothetical protein
MTTLPTINDVRTALNSLARERGNQSAIDTLQTVAGVAALSTLPPDKFGEVIAECEKQSYLGGKSGAQMRGGNIAGGTHLPDGPASDEDARQFWDDVNEIRKRGDHIPKYPAPKLDVDPALEQIDESRRNFKRATGT